MAAVRGVAIVCRLLLFSRDWLELHVFLLVGTILSSSLSQYILNSSPENCAAYTVPLAL